MTAFFSGYLVEVNQYPRFGENLDTYVISDYFYHNSESGEYGARGTVIPTKYISGMPDEETVRFVINNKIPIIKRVIDLNKQEESWEFDSNILKELKK